MGVKTVQGRPDGDKCIRLDYVPSRGAEIQKVQRPTNLNQVLEIFLQWVEAGTPPKGHDADKPID